MKISNKQNRAWWEAFGQWSDMLNERGIGVQAFMTDKYKKRAIAMLRAGKIEECIKFLEAPSSIDVEWTAKGFKENVFRPIAKAMVGSDSMTEVDPEVVNKIFLTIDEIVSEKTGESIPWPCEDEMRMSSVAK